MARSAELIGTKAIDGDLGAALDRHAREAKTLEREYRPITFGRAAFKDVLDVRFGGPEACLVERAMFVENLRVLDDDPGTRLAFGRECNIAGGVLAEIVDRPAFIILPRANDRELSKLAHRCRLLRNEHRHIEGKNERCLPTPAASSRRAS